MKLLQRCRDVQLVAANQLHRQYNHARTANRLSSLISGALFNVANISLSSIEKDIAESDDRIEFYDINLRRQS